MIIVIDPLVKGFSHEMVNAGFVYSISKDNQDKEILFIAEEKHIKCIQDIFESNNYNPSNIKYMAKGNVFNFIKINIKLREYSNKKLIEKYIFLSFDAITVSLIYKFIKVTPVYLVCHAIFEQLIDNSNQREGLAKTKNDILNKISNTSLLSLTKLTLVYAKKYLIKYYDALINKIFNFKKIFLQQSSSNVIFIVLSEHIISNLKNNNVVHNNKIINITMPYIYSENNNYVLNTKLNNFGIVGYGSPRAMKVLVENINSLDLLNKYYFWNIGANASGLKDIKNIYFPIQSGFLSREDINTYSQNLDFTLILYDRKSYTLSCSATIMESIMYMKPIIYLDNSCVNEFNKHDIGIKCDTLKELTECIVNIINNPEKYRVQYEKYMKNIIELRGKLDLKNRVLIKDIK